MSNRDRDFLTRSESKKRSSKSQNRKKLDRLLNVLIAIVAVLILINLYFVFSNDGEKELVEDEVESSESSDSIADNNQNQTNEQDSTSTSNGESTNSSKNHSNDQTSNESSNSSDDVTNETDNEESNEESNEEKTTTTTEPVVVQNSDDPLVEQVIIDPNWKVTPTAQTGEHISTYKKGDIDYEEKIVTIQNAVGLEEDNIIYWSVKNNGSSETSIAVVSSKDQTQNYRVSIEWVQNQGWKPVKVEILNKTEGSY